MTFPDGMRLDARPGHHMAYAGRAQLLTDTDGWVRGGLNGYYHDSTRFLSRMELEIENAAPKPSGVSTVRRDGLLADYVAAPLGPPFDRRLIVSARHHVGPRLTSHYRLDNYDRTRSHRLALALRLEVELPPGGSVEVQPLLDDSPGRIAGASTGTGALSAARRRERLHREAPMLSASESAVERAWNVAVADLAALPLELDGAPTTPAAGLPLYQEYYGRDALTTSWQALPLGPEMMRDTLRYAAATLGGRIDDFFDEEPGKTLAGSGGVLARSRARTRSRATSATSPLPAIS